MAKTKRLLAIEDCAIVARMREGHAAPFPTDTGALVVSVPTANPALAVAALVPLLVRHLPLACATQLRAGADGEVQPLVDAEARQAWAQVDVYSETSAAGVELSRVTCGRNALHKVWANVLECEIVKIGGLNLRGLPAAANIEKEEELKALTELLRPIAERLEIGCVGSFARGSIGRSGTGAAALAEAGELEAAAEGEDDKQEVRRQKEVIEQKARGAATHPHRSCPPPRTRPIARAVTALPPLAAAFALFALPARAGEGVPQHDDAQLKLLHLGRRGGPATARRDFRTKNAVLRRQVCLECHRSARARPQRTAVLGSLVLRGRSHHQQGRVVRGRDRPSRCPRRETGEQVDGDRDAAVGSQWPPHVRPNQERVRQPPTSAKERQAASRCCCGCAGRQEAYDLSATWTIVVYLSSPRKFNSHSRRRVSVAPQLLLMTGAV